MVSEGCASILQAKVRYISKVRRRYRMSVEYPIMMTGSGRMKTLDAIRGVAVALVMLRHAWPDTFGAAGIVGVSVFFVLSGYLITGLLARDMDSHGKIRIKRFYVHRLCRLLPALALVLGVYALVESVWNVLGYRSSVPSTIVGGLTYLSDVPTLFDMGGMSHLWTLAIEEQFYIVWPVVIYVAFSRKLSLNWVLLAMIALLTAACWASLSVVAEPQQIYTLPTTWASCMAFGAGAKLFESTVRYRIQSLESWITPAAGVGLIALSLVPDAKESASTYIFFPTIISLLTIVLIMWATSERQEHGRIVVAMSWLGLISYGVYLWNLPMTGWTFELVNSSVVAPIASIVLTVLAAIGSWFSAELIGRRLRSSFDICTLQTRPARSTQAPN